MEKFIKTFSTIIKRAFGIKDISLLRKKIKKRIGKLIYRKKYNTNDLIKLMCQMGMKKGSLVCVHSSMMQFYNYRGTAIELIEGILNEIGPNGTLMMPAFPIIPSNVESHSYIFKPEIDKTGAGFLAESFRQYPGVKRSFNARASVCAIGPLSDYLLNEHHLGKDCWDKKSPWYKLCVNNGLVFSFGLPRSYMGTWFHCIESCLKEEYPYWGQFFQKKYIFKYQIKDEINTYVNLSCDIYRRTKKKRIMRYFTEEDWKIAHISNLEIKVFYTNHLFPKLLDMARKGITPYYCPSPKGFKFD